MKLFNIVGARPQIIKSAAISRAIKQHANTIHEIVIHSGQHYDENMSAVFFKEMGIPEPKINLNIGSCSHAEQTARMMVGFENYMLQEKPDAVLVYGDTNSTLAAALAAAKIHIPLAHVEAGLRSYNKSMPEEINRIMTDHVSSLLFTPTKTAYENLQKEGFKLKSDEPFSIDNPGIFNVGDVMYDNTMYFKKIAAQKYKLKDFKLRKPFALLTIHRNFNTDNIQNLNNILQAIEEIATKENMPFVFPVHPRVRARLKANNIQLNNIHVIDPVSFLQMTFLEANAEIIATDSGGVQKEAFFMGKACIVLREETEWVEIIKSGNAMLAGAKKQKIVDAYHKLIHKQNLVFNNFYGNAHASESILEVLQHL
ncbi:MAG: non-hydrolyzing UDP-N-acetylglucosamine 2-epimerase [Bacteroidota bacterium]